MENNKRNLVINNTDGQFADCVELRAFGNDGKFSTENLRLDSGENKSCIVGNVDIKSLAAGSDVSPKNVTNCEVQLCGELSGEASGYTVYGINGEVVATGEICKNEDGEAEISIPVQQIAAETGSTEFGVELNGTGALNISRSRVAMSVSSGYGSGAFNIDNYCEIRVDEIPNKTSYAAGEYFNKAGMKVILLGNREIDTIEITDYKIDKIGPLKATDKHVTISFDKFSTQLSIYVEDESVYAEEGKASAEFGENIKVNLATGRLLYVDNDLSIGANSYKISVSHVYNSKLYNSLSKYFGGMPRGWKLDVHQCLISEGGNKYKFIDATGYIHNFTVKNHAHGVDEEGQGLTLTIGSGRYITDTKGNRLEFDSNGRLVKSISGKNSSIRKIYSYTNNLLTKIYDSRKSSAYIELVYKNGLLNGIHAVENGYYKKSIVFEYTSGKLLQYKSVMSDTNKKRLLTYGYTDNKLLKSILNPDGTQATVSYSEIRRVEKISSGYLIDSTFTEKASNGYSYVTTSDNGKERICSTQIKNKDGISLVYYFNVKGEAVSSFELTNNGLVTMKREQGELLFVSNGKNGINGNISKHISASTTLRTDELDLSKYNAENFVVTLWLKHGWNDCGENARVQLIYDVKDEDNNRVAFADISCDANGAWQFVSIPFSLWDKKKIKNIRLSAWNSKNNSPSFYISDCRIAPASRNSILINGDNIDLNDIAYVNIEGEKNEEIALDMDFHCENYLTFQDIMRTLINMAHNKNEDYYDFIYSGGTKCKSGVKKVELVDEWDDRYELTLDNSGKANVVTVVYTADNSHVTCNHVTFGKESITSTVDYKDAENNLLSRTKQVVRYDGSKLSETDEYDVVKEYTYNTYGDLLTETLTGKDGKKIILQNNVYDSINEYVTQSSSGFDSEKYSYAKPFERLDKSTINDYNFGSNTYNESCAGYKYVYDVYGENLTGFIAAEGSGIAAMNKITYANDEPSTVSDGASKYYFDSSKSKEMRNFGVLEYYDKIQLQRVVGNDKTKTNYFYRTKGKVTDTFRHDYDKYGRFTVEFYNGEMKVDFCYNDDQTVSNTASEVSAIYDDYTGNYRCYNFDKNGDATEWEDENVRVVSDGESITFNGKEEYNFIRDYDENINSPRLKATTVKNGDTELKCFGWNYDYTALGLMQSKTSEAGDYWYTYPEVNDRVLPVIEKCGFDSKNLSVEWEYGYDKKGNIKSVQEKINRSGEERIESKSYTYDNFGRLIKENEKSYAYNENGRMIRNGEKACVYDIRGRLVGFGETKIEYDNYGNRTKKGDIEYSYTRGRLLESIAGVASYAYGYDGTRYTKTVNGVTTTFIYDGSKLLGENRSDGVKLRYFYDAQGICGFRYINGKTNQDIIYVKNIQGDVKFLQDINGNVLAQYEYDAWGNHSVLNPDGTLNESDEFIGNINPIRYRGYYFDSESGLYYLMTRYYDPETATFLTLDSVEYLNPEQISGINLYAYCGNNPVMNVDPIGTLFGLILAGIFIGVCIGATINDIVQISKGKKGGVYVDPNNPNQIMNSYKILTPWMQWGYCVYLNYIRNDTKDFYTGSAMGMQFEWMIHNVVYYGGKAINGVAELFGKHIDFLDKYIVAAKNVDLGKTIFDDNHDFFSWIMWIAYFMYHPFFFFYDLIFHKSEGK